MTINKNRCINLCRINPRTRKTRKAMMQRAKIKAEEAERLHALMVEEARKIRDIKSS